MTTVLDHLRQKVNDMASLLRTLVEHETPSDSKPALDSFAELLAGWLKDIGASVQALPDSSAGNHLRAEWDLRPPQDRAAPGGQVLLLCHTDTVWPLGELSRRPFRIEGGRAYGPGALDMKAGIVLGYFAIKALRDLGLPTKLRVVGLFTTDEEVQSRASRHIIEAEGKRSQHVLCLESAMPPSGAAKTARKGIATFNIEIAGKAAHAGVEPEKGVDAVHELAQQVIRLHGLNDSRTGTQVNVGVVSGGTRPNVVAASARAQIDVRFATAAEGERGTRAILGLAPILAGASLTVTGGIERPVMERTPQVAALYQRARDLAASLGFELGEASTGGVSDANFTAALGIPTLDGLGAEGEGVHAVHEYAKLDSFPQRAALIAELVRVLE